VEQAKQARVVAEELARLLREEEERARLRKEKEQSQEAAKEQAPLAQEAVEKARRQRKDEGAAEKARLAAVQKARLQKEDEERIAAAATTKVGLASEAHTCATTVAAAQARLAEEEKARLVKVEEEAETGSGSEVGRNEDLESAQSEEVSLDESESVLHSYALVGGIVQSFISIGESISLYATQCAKQSFSLTCCVLKNRIQESNITQAQRGT
jgi:hypothetical protein